MPKYIHKHTFGPEALMNISRHRLNEPGALMNIGPDIFISTLLVQEHLGTYAQIYS